MRKAEIIKNLIKESGYSRRAFAEKIGIPPTTLQSMLTRGLGKASVDNVVKVCKGLGITTDELEVMADPSTKTELPELNLKDEKDIQKKLEDMINDLSNDGFAAFDGHAIDEMDEEDRELLKASLENSLRLAKRIAKQKFTPNKYKK